MSKSLFIIDDHKMMRNGIVFWFTENTDWQCAGQAGSKDEAMAVLSALESAGKLPDVVISDINLNGSDDEGFDIIKLIAEKWPSIKIAAYSMYVSPGIVQKALDCGAKGYISKANGEEELRACAEDVYAGKVHVEEGLLKDLKSYNVATDALTKRENETLQLILKRKTNLEISEAMNLSLHVVENYISRINDKLNCLDRNDLISRFGE